MTTAMFRRKLKDESGSATVEFALWIPFFVFILMMIIDASMLLFKQADLWKVASDTSRRVAVGEIVLAEAPAYARSRAATGETFTVNVTRTGRDIKTTVSVPFEQVVMSTFVFPPESRLSAVVIQRAEQ